jgi:hypothetical protein
VAGFSFCASVRARLGVRRVLPWDA